MEKKKKWFIRRRNELLVGYWNFAVCLVVSSMTLAWRLQTDDHQSWSSNVERGDRYLMHLVLLRFSKSGKRTVSDGFVKKSADSDSVSDSRGRHYKLIYTGRCRAQRLSTGVRQMRRRCTSQAIVPGWQDATTGQRAVCPTHPARTWTSDAPPAAMQAATHRRTSLHNAKNTCHPPWGSILDGMHWVL